MAKLQELDLQMFWLICRSTGELFLVDAETVQLSLGLEVDYLAETIASDGFFENGDWLAFGSHPTVPVEDR